MKVEVPLGDVVDKVTILAIKRDKIGSVHVEKEWSSLRAAWLDAGLHPMNDLPEYEPLSSTNQALWDVEDRLRQCESEQQFDEQFVALARSVYRLNDERARLKRCINDRLNSKLVEVKSYYDTPTPTIDER
jgi:hypothetical protein